jgi:hypothetical protein
MQRRGRQNEENFWWWKRRRKQEEKVFVRAKKSKTKKFLIFKN